MSGPFGQDGFGVRLDWGVPGARSLCDAAPDGCLVVVDVLSFTTAVSVAVERRTSVFPYAWRDDTAREYARSVRAELATGRRARTPDQPWTLSPAALRDAPAVERLVLPSPNGSTIAATASEPDRVVAAGCLRNAEATAEVLAGSGFGTPERPVLVVPAGERWPDGSLRPALEDLLGAGRIVAALLRSGRVGPASPEAYAAAITHDGTPDIAAAVRACGSGAELAAGGFEADVEVAVELDTSSIAAVRLDNTPARPTPFRPVDPRATPVGPAVA